MDPGMFPTLFALGLVGGFVSGLLGIGGGIVMVPLLLYVPTALGVGALSMKTAASLTAVQSFFGAISGAIGHKRHKRISVPLAYAMGGSTVIGSLSGSIVSVYLTSKVLLMVFAAMAIVAAVMMLIPIQETGSEPEVEGLEFNKPLAVLVGLIIGTLSGIIGQGGAFLFVPAMLYILRIPTRITIGTTLVVGLASSTAVLLGRVGTNQIPYLMSAILIAGILIGAHVGSTMSQRTPQRVLRGILSVLIFLTALKISYELLLA
ncbi:MAG TPA: sulfite exporter TauE/SafE family protein [Sulfuricaulis sp.]|jgi:hypothetical protein|nr:sulfite exporter TauE/SafE family protein [Sulfuricaulis sp.]